MKKIGHFFCVIVAPGYKVKKKVKKRGEGGEERNFVKLFVSSKKYPIQNYKCERGEDGLKMVWKKLPANFPIQNIRKDVFKTLLRGAEKLRIKY